jgi:hypothetical protein
MREDIKSILAPAPDSMSCGRTLALMAMVTVCGILIGVAIHVCRLGGEDLRQWLEHSGALFAGAVSLVSAPYGLMKAGDWLKQPASPPAQSRKASSDQ